MMFCGVVVKTMFGSFSIFRMLSRLSLSFEMRRYASAAARLSRLISTIASSSALTNASYSFGFSFLNLAVVQMTLNVAGPPSTS